jgi:hypothetical protein
MTHRTLPTLLGVGLMHSLALPGTALAGHGHSDAFVEIDNRFDGPAQVWIDGRLEGVVAGDSRTRIDSRPGMHSLIIKRAETGFVLRSESLHLSPRTTTILRVDPPMSTLRIRNPSEAALKVTAGRHDLWISPHTTVELPVRAGNLSLVATTPGDFRVHDRTVWVEPGRRSLTTLDYEPLAKVIVYNRHPHSLRVVVDGREVERIGPGQQEWVTVRPGSHTFQLFHGARLVDSTALRLQPGQQHAIRSEDRTPRPAPPPRLSSTTTRVETCPATGRPISVAVR